MIAAIDRKLYACIEKLNATQKKSLLSFIKTILPGKEEETYTIEQYNRELEEAEAEIARGESYTSEEVFERSKRLIDARKKSELV